MKTGKFRSITALLVTLLVLVINSAAVSAAETYQPSSWSLKKIEISQKAGIISNGFDTKPFTQSITRRDFCELLINTCRIFGTTLPEPPASHPFTDTTDIIAEYSYMLGLTQGTATGIFSPEMPLSREMAATMLSRMRILFQSASVDNNDTSDNKQGAVFTPPEGPLSYTQPMSGQEAAQILDKYSKDSSLVSEWAKAYMADVYTLGILSGTGEGKLDPQSDITREQAAILSLNVLTYYKDLQIQAAGIEECIILKPSGIFISPAYDAEDVFLCWNDIPSASAYDITISKDGVTAYTARINSNYLDLRVNDEKPSRSSTGNTNMLYDTIFGSEKQNIHATLKVVPVNNNGELSVFYLQQDFSISTPWINNNERITGDPSKNQFASIQEANLHMMEITVKVWDLTSSGAKETASITLTVNKNVADDVKSIFEEIYSGKEKFPIKNCIGYAYRDGNSQHSNGTAIDINYEENYFISSKGAILAGKLWKPGVNPYSIPKDGDVVRAFNRYGWYWSPDMGWPNGKDYMHFSLVGR